MARQNTATEVALLKQEVEHLGKHIYELTGRIDKLEKKLDDNYVEKKEFQPLKNIFYGVIALIVTTVFGALLSLIIK